MRPYDLIDSVRLTFKVDDRFRLLWLMPGLELESIKAESVWRDPWGLAKSMTLDRDYRLLRPETQSGSVMTGHAGCDAQKPSALFRTRQFNGECP